MADRKHQWVKSATDGAGQPRAKAEHTTRRYADAHKGDSAPNGNKAGAEGRYKSMKD